MNLYKRLFEFEKEYGISQEHFKTIEEAKYYFFEKEPIFGTGNFINQKRDDLFHGIKPSSYRIVDIEKFADKMGMGKLTEDHQIVLKHHALIYKGYQKKINLYEVSSIQMTMEMMEKANRGILRLKEEEKQKEFELKKMFDKVEPLNSFYLEFQLQLKDLIEKCNNSNEMKKFNHTFTIILREIYQKETAESNK